MVIFLKFLSKISMVKKIWESQDDRVISKSGVITRCVIKELRCISRLIRTSVKMFCFILFQPIRTCHGSAVT